MQNVIFPFEIFYFFNIVYKPVTASISENFHHLQIIKLNLADLELMMRV